MLTRRAVDYKTASYDLSVTLDNAIGSNRKVRAVKKCNPGLRVSREGTDRELRKEPPLDMSGPLLIYLWPTSRLGLEKNMVLFSKIPKSPFSWHPHNWLEFFTILIFLFGRCAWFEYKYSGCWGRGIVS